MTEPTNPLVLAAEDALRALEKLSDQQCGFGQVWGGEVRRWMRVDVFARSAASALRQALENRNA